MKLLIAIVQDKDAHLLGDEFAQANIRATRLSTTGGFLRAGNTTFIIGIEEERVEEALGIIKRKLPITRTNDCATSAYRQHA